MFVKMSENEDKFLVIESCANLALEIPNTFMSAYPGFIVFGKVKLNAFEQNRFFKFGVFEVYKLYLAIVNILNFMTGQNDDLNKDLILTNENGDNYYWIGTNLMRNNKLCKIVKFGIEKQDTITYELHFTLNNFQNFFFCLKKLLITSLCLKQMHVDFIHFIIVLPIEKLAKIDDKKVAMECVDLFLKDSKNDGSELLSNQTFFDLLNYYEEIIIILNKLVSIQVPNYRKNIIKRIL
jgi:hypothetical protein